MKKTVLFSNTLSALYLGWWIWGILGGWGLKTIIFTPGNVGVSSKNVRPHFDDGDRVWFSVTSGVECAASPAVQVGAPTQQPARVTSNSRRKVRVKCSLIKFVVSYYA